MNDEKTQNRITAFESLESIEKCDSTEKNFSQLALLLSQPYQWFRIRAAELLGEVKNDSSVSLLGYALNDRCEYVAAAAAESLGKIGTPLALELLRRAFCEDELTRPHHLAYAIAKFGREGFDVLMRYTASESPTMRYYAARALGSTGFQEAAPKLEEMAESDLEKTSFGGFVATGAKHGLKTLRRAQSRGELKNFKQKDENC